MSSLKIKKSLGNIQQAILDTLFFTAKLSITPRSEHWMLLRKMLAESDIERLDVVKRATYSLYKSKLVKERIEKDGTKFIALTDLGKKYALIYNLEKTKLSRLKKWDGKWRIIVYDVPSKMKKIRDGLRYHLKKIGMREIQQSVFVYPYPCYEEIKFIIDFYVAVEFIHFFEASAISREEKIKKYFNLN